MPEPRARHYSSLRDMDHPSALVCKNTRSIYSHITPESDTCIVQSTKTSDTKEALTGPHDPEQNPEISWTYHSSGVAPVASNRDVSFGAELRPSDLPNYHSRGLFVLRALDMGERESRSNQVPSGSGLQALGRARNQKYRQGRLYAQLWKKGRPKIRGQTPRSQS